MVMAQSLFKAIKQRYPHTSLDVLAPEWSRPLTERMVEVANSISMPLKHGELGLKARYKLGIKLRDAHYQRCYVLPNSFKSGLIPWFAKIPERIGWRGEWRYGLLNQVRILSKKTYPLMVERYVALAFDKTQKITPSDYRPTLITKQDNIEIALKNYQLTTEKPILVMCPGAEFGPSKRWPEKYYAKLANYYLDKGWQVWIFGSAKDSEVAEVIQEQTQARCNDLTGRTKLGEAIDLMSQARMVVTNDSGLMHIAAALSRPLVAVYGSTSPGFTPPLNEKAVVIQESLPCSPCFKRICPLGHHQCMEQLAVEKVINAIEKMVTP
ncbi:MAG: lipopolysaccharide heptosyltransferase II [Proteobacteria bacterium]|nr:lipopolysaccharide heptosyltransferase II [Pseudomonadota bacterium]